MGIFSSKTRNSAPANPLQVTHHLALEGRCGGCGDRVVASYAHQALLGQAGSITAGATCGGCGGYVDVSGRF